MLSLEKFLNRSVAGSSEGINFSSRKRVSHDTVTIQILVLFNQPCKYAKCASKSGQLVDLVRKVFHRTLNFFPAFCLIASSVSMRDSSRCLLLMLRTEKFFHPRLHGRPFGENVVALRLGPFPFSFVAERIYLLSRGFIYPNQRWPRSLESFTRHFARGVNSQLRSNRDFRRSMVQNIRWPFGEN